MPISSANRVAQTLLSYQNTLDNFQKKLQKPSSKITTAELKAFLETIKKANRNHRQEVIKINAQKSQNAQLAHNTANAIRNFLANLATVKGVIETAAIHVLEEVEEELDKEEKFLEVEARNEYNTVSDIEKGAQDFQ